MTPELTRGRLVRVLTVALVFAIVVPFAVFAVPQAIGADASFVVVSGSMEPAISIGDAVVVDTVADEDVGVGDVITYATADRSTPTTHRVVDVVETDAGPEFVTKGDNNEDPDASTVAPEQLVGRVVLTIPYVGYVVGFVGTTTGFALLVVAPLALLVATELRSVLGRLRGENDEGSEPLPDDGAAGSDGEAGTASELGIGSGVGQDPDEPAGWSIGTRDLTVTMAVVGVAALYSGAIAYLVYDGSVTYLRLLQLSASAFAGFAVAFAVLLSIRLVVEPAVDEADASDTGVLRGTLDPETRSLPTVVVGDEGDLRSMAAGTGRWLVHDETDDRLTYSDGTMLYVTDGPDADVDVDVSGDDDAWAALFEEAFTDRESESDEFVVGPRTKPDPVVRPDGGGDDDR